MPVIEKRVSVQGGLNVRSYRLVNRRIRKFFRRNHDAINRPRRLRTPCFVGADRGSRPCDPCEYRSQVGAMPRTAIYRFSAHLLFADEDALRQLDVHAEIGLVHQLRDRDIARDAHQLIGLMARELLRRHQEIHHLLNG